MAIYAIGDVQGCLSSLKTLLDRIQFDAGRDQIWFTGDLVNRGPDSLGVLRFVRDLGESAVTVLGNHDLHLLAVANDNSKLKHNDTLDDILAADDRTELLNWLRQRPLMHRDSALGYVMVHAGLIPQWGLNEAQQLANEVEVMLRSDNYRDFFAHMYGNQPLHWDAALSGWDRLRFITNVFTRLRYCDDAGRLDLEEKAAPADVVASVKPWFSFGERRNTDETILFGHWSTLGYTETKNVVCLDSGCLWGGCLTALRLDRSETSIHQVDCIRQQPFDVTT